MYVDILDNLFLDIDHVVDTVFYFSCSMTSRYKVEFEAGDKVEFVTVQINPRNS